MAGSGPGRVVSVRGSPRDTKSERSKELGQDHENPISARTVWGIRPYPINNGKLRFLGAWRIDLIPNGAESATCRLHNMYLKCYDMLLHAM